MISPHYTGLLHFGASKLSTYLQNELNCSVTSWCNSHVNFPHHQAETIVKRLQGRLKDTRP